MRKFVLIFASFLLIQNLTAQSEAYSARALSMGFIGQTDTSVFSIFYNQGQLAKIQGFSAGISYQNFLSLPGYDLKSLALAYGFEKSGTIGLSFSSVGIPDYQEQRLGLAYAMQLWKNFYAGMQLNFQIVDQPKYYGNIYTATAEISAVYSPVKDLNIGFKVYNFWYGLIKSQNFPLILALAMDYKFAEKAYFTAEIEKNIFYPTAYKWGAEYRIIKNVGLRIGGRFQNNIYTYTLGIDYELKNFGIQIGFANHPLTGFTGGISLNYHF